MKHILVWLRSFLSSLFSWNVLRVPNWSPLSPKNINHVTYLEIWLKYGQLVRQPGSIHHFTAGHKCFSIMWWWKWVYDANCVGGWMRQSNSFSHQRVELPNSTSIFIYGRALTVKQFLLNENITKLIGFIQVLIIF